MKLGVDCIKKWHENNGGKNGGICKSQKSDIKQMLLFFANTSAYSVYHAPPIVPPLIGMSIFKNYYALALCGYNYNRQKPIFDDFRCNVYRHGKM